VDAHYMLQEEVAERAAAGAGTPEYGLLSVVLGWEFEARVVQRLSPGAFRPPPRVRSAFLRLVPRPASLAAGAHEIASAVVSAGFAQRRKKLINALVAAGWTASVVAEACVAVGIDASVRAGEIGPAEWVALARALGPAGVTP